MPLVGGQDRVFLGKRAQSVAWSPMAPRSCFTPPMMAIPPSSRTVQGANVHQIFLTTWRAQSSSRLVARRPVDLFHPGRFNGEPSDAHPVRGRRARTANPTEHELGDTTPIDLHTVLYVSREADGSGPWLWALDVDRRVTRRISVGLEKYTFLSRQRRRAATRRHGGQSHRGLVDCPILDRPAEETAVKPFLVPTVRVRLASGLASNPAWSPDGPNAT